MGVCILCNENATINRQESSSRSIYNCPLCGVFILSDLVVEEVKKYPNELAAFFMSRKLTEHNSIVMISYEKAVQDKSYTQLTVQQILDGFPTTFSEKVDLVLQNLANMSRYAGDEIRIDRLSLAPLFYVQKSNFEAFSFMIKAMDKMELLEVNFFSASFFPCGVIITPKGWDRLSQFQKGMHARETALLSQPREDNEISRQFQKYASKSAHESGFKVIETSTISTDGSINLELIAQIRQCRFILCDLSNANGEGYYTAGMATALNKPCILTCHVSCVKNLRVDTGQIHVHIWRDETELHMILSSAIRAFIL